MHLIPLLGVEEVVGISVGDKVETLEYDDDRWAEWMHLGKLATGKKSWLNLSQRVSVQIETILSKLLTNCLSNES